MNKEADVIRNNLVKKLLEIIEEISLISAENDHLRESTTLKEYSEYDESYGNVLWWKLPISEPPYAGSPLDDDFPVDYYTHWTKIIEPVARNKQKVQDDIFY